MLHIPGILDYTYHLHVSVSVAQGSSIAEYLDFSRIAVKRDTCVLVCLYALRGFTRPSYISWGGGWGLGGWGGMMTTLVHRHPEQYLHTSRFTWYLQYFRDGGPSSMMMVDDGDHDDDDA